MPSHVPVQAKRPSKDRRAASGHAPALRRLKGALGRPIGLERRADGLHVVLVDRRRRLSHPLASLCDELRSAVLEHEDACGVAATSELVTVHDALDSKGWEGVAALNAATLKRALLGLELVAARAPSPTLSAIVDELRMRHAAAEARDDRLARRTSSIAENTEITESTHEEFEAAARSWTPEPDLPPKPPEGA